jgi:hypothetical protein
VTADVRRVFPTGVRCLEIWDLPTADGGLLYEAIGAERAAHLRADGAPEDAIATELARPLSTALATLRARHRFDQIWVGGGLARIARPLAADSAVPITLSAEGAFHGLQGARLLLPEGGVLLDLGQTALKIATIGGPLRRTFERDVSALPIARDEAGPPSPPLDQKRELARLLDFMTAALAEAIPEESSFSGEAILLSLPCHIDDAGCPGACTYAGLEGASDFAACLAERIQDLRGPRGEGRPVRMLVLADSELAGLAAVYELGAPRRGTTLALTLGFGPGAALVDEAQPSIRWR